MKRSAIAIILLILARMTAMASPNYVNFQARLTDLNGKPLPAGAYKVELNFYNDATGGNKLWGPYLMDDQTSLTGHAAKASVDGNGRFNASIGPRDTAGVYLMNAFASPDCYVEVRVQDGNPILPRQQFMSTPFTFRIPNVYPSGSYLGIGTNAPAYTLDINGALKVSGATTVSGQLVAASLSVSPTGSISGFGSCPVGAIIGWHKSLTGVGALPSNWLECSGQLITDSGSPLYGKTLPDLNHTLSSRPGFKGLFLRGDLTSGNQQADEVKTHSHTYDEGYFIPGNNRWNSVAGSTDGCPGVSQNRASNTASESRETCPYSYTVVWIMRIK
ncbi:MAG: hypothetical protein NTX50_01790 [Candidatus Sumerlaeota bacterium]|nr:hypothetical protein [Candidatus Sumerlaeota bacterium]